MPELAHFFGLMLADCDALSWRQLNHYRAQLPGLPPIGAVYPAEPSRT